MSSQAVAEKNQALPANIEQHPASDTGSLLQVITRAASDKSVDIDKMERLMAMHERLVERDAKQAFNRALTECQAEMQPIRADADNPQTRSKYASYPALDAALRPIYTRHGFSLSFDEGDSPKPEHVRVLCYVAHEEGFTRTYHRDMPADGKGAKGGDVMTKTHAAGAAGSYGARYLLQGIFNVAVSRNDTDGNMPGEAINEKQLLQLEDLIAVAIDEIGGTAPKVFRPNMLKHLKVESLDQLPAKYFQKAVDAINSTRPKK